MAISISVITPALPTRRTMLWEACASVQAQTLPPVEHLVGFDYGREGTGAVKTQLADAATGDWVATLEDDDLFDPDHLRTLAERAGRDDPSDIVYSWCRVEGRDGWCPNRAFDADALRQGNFIPSTALIRTGLVRELGGWRASAECANGWEDWDFWLRALDAGAWFRCVPRITWTYRFHEGCKTICGEGGAY